MLESANRNIELENLVLEIVKLAQYYNHNKRGLDVNQLEEIGKMFKSANGGLKKLETILEIAKLAQNKEKVIGLDQNQLQEIGKILEIPNVNLDIVLKIATLD